MLTLQSSEINRERNTSQNEATKKFVLKVLIIEIDFTFWNWCWRCKYSWGKSNNFKKAKKIKHSKFKILFSMILRTIYVQVQEEIPGHFWVTRNDVFSSVNDDFSWPQLWLVEGNRYRPISDSYIRVGQVEPWRCWSKLKWVSQTKFLASLLLKLEKTGLMLNVSAVLLEVLLVNILSRLALREYPSSRRQPSCLK